MDEDLLAEPLADDVFIEDDHGNSVTVEQIRAYNDLILQSEQSFPPPIPPGPVYYRQDGGGTVIYAKLTISRNNLLSLSREAAPPIRVGDAAAQAQDEFDAMLALLKSGRSDDLMALLDDQIRIRQGDVIRLGRLLYVHQTALQNAVDIVQTKRIDFLEHKKDTWVEGAIGALFLAVLFTFIPVEALISQALLELSKSAFRVFGARTTARLFSGKHLLLTQEIAELENNVKMLRGLARTSGKGRVTSRTKFSRAQVAAFKAADAVPARDAKAVSAATDKTKELIAGLKAQRTANDEADKRYRDVLVEHAASGFVAPAKATSAVVTKGLENTAFNNAGTLVQQAFAASGNSSVLPADGTPLDIALKGQIHGMYASLLFAAEDTLAALQEFRAASTGQTPDDERLVALENILIAEADVAEAAKPKAAGNNNSASQKVDISPADVQQLINRGTEAFEKLIWILMYGNQLVRRASSGFLPSGPAHYVGTSPDPDHELLLNYLKARFYPDKSTLEIGLAYETIFAAIDNRNSEDAAQPLDLSCFADSQSILKTIEDARLHKITLPPG
jgi:hypothetical protein